MTADVDLRSVSDLLYGLSPAEFTTERDAQVARARAAGDAELAATIKKLQRPTASAALVNLLLRESRERIDALLDIGKRLRQAQESLAADDLREFSQQRRAAVDDLVKDAKRIAADRGQSASDAVLGQVRSTLQAASADESAATLLRDGALTKPLQYSGFGGGGDVTQPTATAPRKPATRATKVANLDAQRMRRESAESLKQAQDACTARDHELTEARLRTEEQRRAVMALEAQLLSEREALATAKRQLASAQRAHAAAERDLKAAEQAFEKASHAVERTKK